MTDICHGLAASFALNVVDDGGHVIGTHVIPGVIPELFLLHIGVIFCVRSTERVTARVAQPDVVASSGCDKSWRIVSAIDNPAECGVEKSVLHHHGSLLASGFLTSEAGDTIDGKDVPIFRGNFVLLEGKTVLGTNLLERALPIAAVDHFIVFNIVHVRPLMIDD